MINSKTHSEKSNHQFDIAVIGTWHLAYTSAAVLSSVGHRVALVNPEGSQATPSSQFPESPVMEPGLPEMVNSCVKDSRLIHWQGFQGWSAETVWLAIDTPVNDEDEPDTEPLVKAISKIKDLHPECRTLMISSQLPIGFSRQMQEKFHLPIVYIPENLRLGKGIETFLKADRTVIGAEAEVSRLFAKDLLKGFQTEFLLCGLETAEMTKHATNVFLATSISFANELARLGERFGVESAIVAKALKMDKRIGPAAYVAPGLGFAGGTLPRDLRIMQKVGKEKSIPTSLIDAVYRVNQETTTAVAETVMDRVRSLGRPPEVLVLGYTYKADIDTLRRSLTIEVASRLKKEGCRVWGFDPVMDQRDLTPLKSLLHHCAQIEQCEVKPDVILVMTARPAFKTIDWSILAKDSEQTENTLLIDTQNLFSREDALKFGFDFKPLWSPVFKNPRKA